MNAPNNTGSSKIRHVLRTSAGFQVEMFLDEETGAMSCQWSPRLPRTKSQLRRISREYEPWRNDIISQWSQRHGKKVLVIDLAESPGGLTEIDGAKISPPTL
jgi:phage-related protein